MRRHVPAFIALALGLALVPSCGNDPEAPEGFVLTVQLEGVDAEVVDELRLTVRPDTTGGPGGFVPTDPVTYEDGGITLTTDRGVLVIRVTGDHLRAHSRRSAANHVLYDLELWSDDEMMRRGPQVLAVATRATEQIATGAIMLPSWPVELGAGVTVRVPCRMEAASSCRL